MTGMFGVRGTGDTSGYGRLAPRRRERAVATRPLGGDFDVVVDELEWALGESAATAVERVSLHRGQLTVHVARTQLERVARTLRDHPALQFDFCAGVSGVHYPDDIGRELHVVYPLLSVTHRRRIQLEVACPDGAARIPSLTAVYPTCDWHERETYDFFGIVFDGHPALTRIELPDDWEGHPLRKDYPLGGIPVQFHGAEIPPPDQRRSYR